MTILLATAAVTFAAFTAIWAVSIVKQDAGIVDFYWGPGFAVIAWLGWWISGTPLPADLAFTLAVSLWGFRLGWYMTARHSGAEDARYADMRRRHGESFGRRSLWMVFWLQAAIQWIAASPSLALMTAARGVKAAAPSVPLQAVIVGTGAVLFILGFCLEVAADRAVARFRADPGNRGKLLTAGLHSRIRHPNYLGEIILQWGLGLFALGLTLQPLALVGSALMTGLIIRLSGVPLLEAQFESRPGFAEWKARTGALWPRLFT
jgi:steroid 5-alpha reductase family enzyme